MPRRIADLLATEGPLTGAEVHRALGGEVFPVWRTCRSSPQFVCRRVSRRYLRFDRRVEGFARLSPSVLREFLTYTVVGLARDPVALEARAADLQAHITRVSRQKRDLAARIMTDVTDRLDTTGTAESRFCAVLAGDIVYEMAHDVDRPERSTGALVHGSDLDIVVTVSDDAPEGLLQQLDQAIYQQKAHYLRNPAFREEIDYVVKRFARLVEQARFDTFPHMVACKIFDEAVLLRGNPGLFSAGKALLSERGVIRRLRALEESAIRSREHLEEQLLAGDGPAPGEDAGFYTDDEAAEFE